VRKIDLTKLDMNQERSANDFFAFLVGYEGQTWGTQRSGREGVNGRASSYISSSYRLSMRRGNDELISTMTRRV